MFRISPRSSLLVAITRLLLLAVVATSGCRKSESTPSSDGTSREEVTRYDGLTAAEVIHKMAEVYRNATSYSDRAEYAEHFTDAARGVLEQTEPHTLAVKLVRPNRFLVTREVPAMEGTLQRIRIASDGKRLVGEVSDLSPQVLEIDAPAETSPESIAPDPQLRSALLPVPMENLYPQLSLLLGTESAPSWPAVASDRLEMLPPKMLERKSQPSVDCYRVRIATPLGAYIYWVDRHSHLLHRLELPSDEVRKLLFADRNLGSYQLIIDFYDVKIDANIPEEEFRLDIPAEAELVTELTQPASTELAPPSGPELEPPEGTESQNDEPANGDQQPAVEPAADTSNED